MVVNTTHLGGTATDVTVGRVSHGLMMMGSTPESTDEVCFASIKAGVDALPPGAKMFLNSGEFYSKTWGPENLDLLSRFFAKYPEYADKTFLSVKGAMVGMTPDCSLENLRKSVLNIQSHLGPYKKMDLYQPARIDPKIPIEDIMKNLVVLLKEGHFSHIGLSECSAKTLGRAHAVHPVTAAEIEVSLWAYEPETKNVIETARELGISVLGYSPIGKGFFASKSSSADLPAGDYRTHWERLKGDNLAHNMSLVSALPQLAEKKGVTPAQLAIAWVAALGPHVIPLPGSSRATRTLENCAAGDIELSAEEMSTLTKIAEAAAADVKGGRMAGGPEETLLWG
ncbi:Aldo/keto reductase [Mycena sanguinolenta]|uniref:Aldo/keto reductase n=1 Tax=Mycena sanguinolenta TaxID=230812 RepID=A0A8H6XZH0_9AGAR|nr:Aldo/keto reductase [Mycena sanguinolenta]